MFLKDGQKGAATLIMSIVVLVLVTLVVIYTSRSINLELKASANMTRSKQALEAAEAGIAYALENYKGGSMYCMKHTTLDADTSTAADDCISIANQDIGDGTKRAPNIAGASNVASSFYLEVDNGTVISQGYSDDKTAMRVIWVDLETTSPLPNGPDNPFTTWGTAGLDGSGTVYNPEGHTTIWSGKTTDYSNGSMDSAIANPADVNYPTCLDVALGVQQAGGGSSCELTRTSNKDTKGLDVVENDASLSSLTNNQFFENFFGTSKSTYQDLVESQWGRVINADDYASEADVIAAIEKSVAEHSYGEVIWINGYTDGSDLNLSGVTLGCRYDDLNGNGPKNVNDLHPKNTCSDADTTTAAYDLKPSLVILNGENGGFKMNGNFSVNGLLYTIGNLDTGGGGDVQGAVIVEGDGTLDGSWNIWYDSAMLDAIADLGGFAISAGTWRDYSM